MTWIALPSRADRGDDQWLKHPPSQVTNHVAECRRDQEQDCYIIILQMDSFRFDFCRVALVEMTRQRDEEWLQGSQQCLSEHVGKYSKRAQEDQSFLHRFHPLPWLGFEMFASQAHRCLLHLARSRRLPMRVRERKKPQAVDNHDKGVRKRKRKQDAGQRKQ